ncbi:hypothetical protein J2T56_002354 [Natronobacillus azotifigens]|uniref:Uncharacterized protein n=1 Tax=Natronobacillus azotifigens TaxID=472978 RepID=A0A9J6RFC4_9BACI|nr:hypothetical protein [Natronobacillus azotifigens]MCZ0704110.1 hypothetical protein [Natronobacillus azotifigens]
MEDKLVKVIIEKEVAQLKEENTYSFFSDFIYQNKLEEKFIRFLRKEQKKYADNSVADREDYDHIAMDFE